MASCLYLKRWLLNEGIDAITDFILSNQKTKNTRRELLLTQKVYNIIQQNKMMGVDKQKLQQDITKALVNDDFNIYRFAENYVKTESPL